MRSGCKHSSVFTGPCAATTSSAPDKDPLGAAAIGSPRSMPSLRPSKSPGPIVAATTWPRNASLDHGTWVYRREHPGLHRGIRRTCVGHLLKSSPAPPNRQALAVPLENGVRHEDEDAALGLVDSSLRVHAVDARGEPVMQASAVLELHSRQSIGGAQNLTERRLPCMQLPLPLKSLDRNNGRSAALAPDRCASRHRISWMA